MKVREASHFKTDGPEVSTDRRKRFRGSRNIRELYKDQILWVDELEIKNFKITKNGASLMGQLTSVVSMERLGDYVRSSPGKRTIS